MKLSKINYGSAVFFGVFTLVMSLFYGFLQWSARDVLAQAYGVEITSVQAFVLTPIVGGVIGYAIMVVAILIYNFVARKYPIGWEIKK